MSDRQKRVFIGLPCGELARYSAFWQTYRDLDIEGLQVASGMANGLYIDYLQNSLVRKMFDKEKELDIRFDYFWLLNDDMIMPKGTLKKLIEADKDIIVPLMMQHELPFDVLFFDYQRMDGLYHHKYLEPGERGLTQGRAAGGGGMLIKREVFDAFPDPWWETHWDYPKPGDTDPNRPDHPTRSTEDFDFCKKARDAGFEIWLDQDCPVGHQTMFTVWPVRLQDDVGSWGAAVERHGKHVVIPAALDPATHKPEAVLAQ